MGPPTSTLVNVVWEKVRLTNTDSGLRVVRDMGEAAMALEGGDALVQLPPNALHVIGRVIRIKVSLLPVDYEMTAKVKRVLNGLLKLSELFVSVGQIAVDASPTLVAGPSTSGALTAFHYERSQPSILALN